VVKFDGGERKPWLATISTTKKIDFSVNEFFLMRRVSHMCSLFFSLPENDKLELKKPFNLGLTLGF